MLLDDSEKIISLIVEKSGKQRMEVQELIEKKKERFSGLLTDSGAAFLVAKELNADLELEKNIGETSRISELETGARNVDLEVKALQCFQPREFEKNSRKGIMQNLIVGDDSGSIRLTLWNKNAVEFEKQKVEKESILLLKNCFVSEFNGRKQLNLAFNGRMILKERSSKHSRLEELKNGMQNVDIVARIARIFPEKNFSTNERQGRLVNFELLDSSKRIRATAWNEMVEEILKLEENDIVKVENAYTKERAEVELHLGWQSRIIKNPVGVEIPEIPKIIVERKKIRELEEGKPGEVKASIIAFQSKKPVFEVCAKCNSRVEKVEESFVCKNCRGETKVEFKVFARIEVDDGSARIAGIAFGKEAEKIVESSASEIKKELEGKSVLEVIEGLKEKALGKELVLQGVKRLNKLSGVEEFLIKRVATVNPTLECKKISKTTVSYT